MTIQKLHFTGLGPFDHIEFEFDEHVNVLTGPNNSGKTTALLVLAELLVYPFGVPSKLRRSPACSWEMQYRTEGQVETISGSFPSTASGTMMDLYETVGYTCFVPAQRANSDYRSPGPTSSQSAQTLARSIADQAIETLPEILSVADPDMIRRSVFEETRLIPPELQKRRRLLLSGAGIVNDSSFIQKMIDLDYAAYRRKDANTRSAIETIASVASEITEGFPVTFVEIAEDSRGLYPIFDTPDGKLPFDALSQGTQSIIHSLARLVLGYAEYYDFPSNFDDKPGAIIIDEIDAHLHPAWQRRFIPALTRRFPKLQIFCSTHSPLMLAGLGPGQVQLLRRDREGRVTVSVNESDIDGWTSDEILRNLLEVADPTDIRSVQRLARLQQLRGREALSPTEAQELETLRREVGHNLLRSPRLGRAMEFAEELRNAIRGTPSEQANPITDD